MTDFALQSKTTEIDFRESRGAGQERGRCAASCDWGSSDLISSKGPSFIQLPGEFMEACVLGIVLI